MTQNRPNRTATDCHSVIFQVGFLISPVLVEHSGQYWCRAEYGGRDSDYGVSLNVLMETR